MTIGFQIWLGLASLTGLVWLGRLYMIGRLLRKRKILRSYSHPDPPDPAPGISVIVAAKDEEENIETCVTSLLCQDYPSFELIVVDDRSQDQTPHILRQLADRACGKLRVVTVTAMREGWFGKQNAMQAGVNTAIGEWFCFTDADCRLVSTRTLTVAMGEARRHNVDFLSVTPVLEARTVWERVIQPVCALILMVWFRPSRVNDPNKKTAYANGAFMLMRRSCYKAIGGHEGVRDEISEDIHMARLAKRRGWRLRVVENEDLYRTRMYRTFGDAWQGWSRIFYGSLGRRGRLVAAAFLVTLLVLVPWISLGVALAGRLAANPFATSHWTMAVWAWSAVIVLKQTVLWRLYPVVRIARPWSLTYVVGAVIALGMLINAMLKVVRATATTWRGTTYRGHRLEIHRAEPSDQTPSSVGPKKEASTNA